MKLQELGWLHRLASAKGLARRIAHGGRDAGPIDAGCSPPYRSPEILSFAQDDTNLLSGQRPLGSGYRRPDAFGKNHHWLCCLSIQNRRGFELMVFLRPLRKNNRCQQRYEGAHLLKKRALKVTKIMICRYPSVKNNKNKNKVSSNIAQA